MTDQSGANLQISGNAPLYSRPEPLSPEVHGKLGLIHNPNPFGICQNQHFVPLTVNEFGRAACFYPIIFAGDEKAPLAVLGLKPGQNLYSTEAMSAGELYVPAYIRRYPFTVANAKDGDQIQSIVCIDIDSPLIGENPDEPFFKDGVFTGYTEHCVKFCQDFEDQRGLTANVIRRLRELDVFEHRTVEYRPDGPEGAPTPVAGFFSVSQQKLNALPVETYIQLRDLGILSAVFSHWISQGHWDELVVKAALRDKAETAPAKPAAKAKAKPAK